MSMALEVECIDRMYLNLVSTPGGWVSGDAPRQSSATELRTGPSIRCACDSGAVESFGGSRGLPDRHDLATSRSRSCAPRGPREPCFTTDLDVQSLLFILYVLYVQNLSPSARRESCPGCQSPPSATGIPGRSAGGPPGPGNSARRGCRTSADRRRQTTLTGIRLQRGLCAHLLRPAGGAGDNT